MPQNLCRCGPQVLGAANRAVYCSGPLLDAVQRSNMFPDCKTFVDMKSKYPPERLLADYELFRNCRKNDGSFQFLQMFVEKHFLEKGTELEEWTPPDWKSEPPFANRIADPQLRKFGVELNALWKVLGRRMKDEVKENPEKYSIVYVPNPVIVPGGRFIEFYYWDSLWIIRGLLHCGMHATARGMIDNFLSIVRQYGFVPNGGRIYYYGRSQPPMLIHMMKAYVDVTLDEKYAMQSLPLLEAEFDNFVEKHQVQVKGRTMYHYQDYSTGPRPESYREDVASAAEFLSEPEKERHYTQLKSACESGMDFSSRWFIARDGTNRGTLKDIQTTSIVPVDLNVILFRSAKILAEFNRKAGHNSKVEEYSDIACGLVKAVRDVLWNEEAGIWLDYDMLNNRPRPYFSASNFSPLWARAFPLVDTDKISRGVMNYIKVHNLDDYPGGVPNTMNRDTGQQWDYPNVWPPMMFMIIDGLHNLGTPEARAMSERWAHRWVKNNYEAYAQTGFMFEKYNCEKFGSGGGGGEYQNQTGFGWTNGIILEYLSRYGPELSLEDRSDVHCSSRVGKAATGKLGDCPVTSESKMITKKNYIITSENNIAGSNSPFHTPDRSPGHSPGHCSGPCAQKVVDEASNRMKQSLVSNMVGHPVVASPKRATTTSGRSTITATGRSTIPKSGRSTITSYPQLEEASTGEYNASMLAREQASAIPYTREQGPAIPYTREQSTSPTLGPGRSPIASAPESRLPTAVETTVFPERYTRAQSAADPYLREQSAADPSAREQSTVAPYLREQSAADPYLLEQSAADPYAREQSAADPYSEEKSAADPYSREQSAADPYGRQQSAADPYAREQSAVDPYGEEKSTADPYSREQSTVEPYSREQSAVAAYSRVQSAVGPEQYAVGAYSREQSVVGREQSALSGAGRTTIPSQRESSSRKSVEYSGSPARYSREKSAADPYSREQSAIAASNRDQSSAIQSPARSPTLTVDNHNNPLLILTVENNNNNNVILNQRQSRSPSNPSPVPREQASAVPTQGKSSIDQSSFVEYTGPNDPYSQEQSADNFYSQEQSDAEPFSREQSAIDNYNRQQSAVDPYTRGQTALDPYNREQSAVDPYTPEQSAVDPYDREQSAMDPYTRGQSAADPNGREQSAIDPYSRQQSAAAAYNRDKSSADPYKRKQSAADPNNREQSAMDPYSRGQSAFDAYNREKSSAYNREQSAVDPYSREQSAMDSYNQEQSAVDPYSRQVPPTDPYSREQSAMDPYNREQSAMDPYNEQSAVDPYIRQVSAMDPYHREHSSMDPYSQEQSLADPYSREQSVVDPSTQEQATADPSKSKTPCQRCLGLPTNGSQPQYRIMAAVPFTAAAVPYNAPIQPQSYASYDDQQSAAVPFNGEQSAADPRLVRTTLPGQRETRFTAAPMYAPSAMQQEVLLSPCECSFTAQNSNDMPTHGQDMQGPPTASLAPHGSRSQSGYDPPDTPDLPEGCFVCPRCGGLKQQAPPVQCKATNQPSLPVVPARQAVPVASVEEDCECGPPTSSMQAAPAPVSQTESDCSCTPPASSTKLPAIKQFPLADKKGTECPQEKRPQRMCCGCPIPSPPQAKDDC